jgi:hypothetical protein
MCVSEDINVVQKTKTKLQTRSCGNKLNLLPFEGLNVYREPSRSFKRIIV